MRLFTYFNFSLYIYNVITVIILTARDRQATKSWHFVHILFQLHMPLLTFQICFVIYSVPQSQKIRGKEHSPLISQTLCFFIKWGPLSVHAKGLQNSIVPAHLLQQQHGCFFNYIYHRMILLAITQCVVPVHWPISPIRVNPLFLVSLVAGRCCQPNERQLAQCLVCSKKKKIHLSFSHPTPLGISPQMCKL